MNEDYPPLRLPRPEFADRRPERRFVPLTSDVIARRHEIARVVGGKIRKATAKLGLSELNEDQRRAVFVKLEHDGKIKLDGTGLKAISQSDVVTLAVPTGENLDRLADKIDEFGTGPLQNGQPKNAMLVTRLTDIKPGQPKDRLSDELFKHFARLTRRAKLIIEIEITSVLRYPKERHEEIEGILKELIDLLKSDQPYGALFEHEELRGTCRAVIRCSGKMFKHLVMDPDWQTKISWFEERPEFETFTSILDNFNVSRLGDFIPPPDAAPIVCIVDSGITPGNPFLQPVTREELIHSFLKDKEDNPYDEYGHGSAVASLAAYYALNIADGGTNIGRVWIASARVLDEHNHAETRLFSKALKDVVLTLKPLGVRVFNLSVGIRNRQWNAENKRTVPRNSWIARAIDQLSREHDVLFVISTGNIYHQTITEWNENGKSYPAYLADESSRMLDPGQSALSITVGSIAPGTLAVGNRLAFALAEQFQPSPFTRSGPGIKGEIKPELVEFGGNSVRVADSDTVLPNPGTDVLVASHQVTPALARFVGTSYAAPRVAQKAALILSDLESLGIEHVPSHLLRAFLVNSAVYPGSEEFDDFVTSLDVTKPKHWMHVLGYGVPDRGRATDCDDHTVILYYQGSINPGKVAFFHVPVPSCLSETGTCLKRLSVTVASTPSVQRWGLEEYLSTSLKWRLFRGNVDRNQVIEMMSVDDEEAGNSATESDAEDDGSNGAGDTVEDEGSGQPGRPREVSYRYGINLRSRGTVQHDVTDWQRHRVEYSSSPYTLAIAARENWGGSTTPLPFAVVVRIEDTSRKARVYAEVRQILADIEIQAQGRA